MTEIEVLLQVAGEYLHTVPAVEEAEEMGESDWIEYVGQNIIEFYEVYDSAFVYRLITDSYRSLLGFLSHHNAEITS